MAGQIVQQLCKTGASQELNYTSVGRTILKTVHNNAQKRDEGVSGCSCPEAISAILKQMAEQAIPHLLHLCFFIGTSTRFHAAARLSFVIHFLQRN